MLLGDSTFVALSRGFATLSTAQANLGHNVNLVAAAESLVMAKEHLIENYGSLRYTIGTGCSGGATPPQWSFFYGHLPVNPIVSDQALFPAAFPDQDDCPGLEDQSQVYDAETNPGGLRCGLIDYMRNLFGPRAPVDLEALGAPEVLTDLLSPITDPLPRQSNGAQGWASDAFNVSLNPD